MHFDLQPEDERERGHLTRSRWKHKLTVLLCVMLACGSLACARAHQDNAAAVTAQTIAAPGLLKEQRRAMGTQVEITLWARPEPATYSAIDAAYAEMTRLEKLMTSWEHPQWPESDVMRINKRAGQGDWVKVAPETFAVLELGLAMSQASHGAFDITYAPLRDVWHFDEDATATVPDQGAVKARLADIGFAGLELDVEQGAARLLRPGMRIDLGGIAKGAIVDGAVKTLRSRGLNDFIVQAGGDMFASGRRGERPWRVAVQDPRNSNEHLASVALHDKSFSTAGDYERGFVREGQRYHHILDPRTGYPATASRSVTVEAPTALLADALDNAVFILGPGPGMELLERYAGCEAVIVDAEGMLHVTEGLRARLNYQDSTVSTTTE